KPDLEGFRLVRNIPGQAKPAEKVAPPPPPPVPVIVGTGPRTLGEVVTTLPETVIDLSVWELTSGVKLTKETGGDAVDTVATGGYQMMSPLMAIPASRRVLMYADGVAERGRICLGGLAGARQKGLAPH